MLSKIIRCVAKVCIWLRFGKKSINSIKISGERSKNGSEWSLRKVVKFTCCILNCKIKRYSVDCFLRKQGKIWTMSLGKIQNVFGSLSGAQELSLQLLMFTISKKTRISYTGREIIFSPDGALSKLVTEISERYTIELSKNYTSVQDYDGSVVGNVIYIIAVSNDLIRENYNKLISSLAAPDTKIPPFEFYAQAYVIKGALGR